MENLSQGKIEMFFHREPTKQETLSKAFQQLDDAIAQAVSSGVDLRSLAEKIEQRADNLRQRWAIESPIGY
jgi:hypothetical protein